MSGKAVPAVLVLKELRTVVCTTASGNQRLLRCIGRIKPVGSSAAEAKSSNRRAA